MTRPVYGITVLRYADGRTEVLGAIDEDDLPDRSFREHPIPADWRLRHRMLIDACEVVKREAGVSEPAFRASGAIASAEQEDP